MGTEVRERRFAAMGARAKVIRTSRDDAARIDVGSDREEVGTFNDDTVV
jgi:hypothetical protein